MAAMRAATVTIGAVLAVSGLSAHAVSLTWDGSANNQFFNAANWTPFNTPDINDTATIGNAPRNDVVLDRNGIVGGLTLENGASLNNNNLQLRVRDGVGGALMTIRNGVPVIVLPTTSSAFGLGVDRLVIQSGGSLTDSGWVRAKELQNDVGGNIFGNGLLELGAFFDSSGATRARLNNNGTITAGVLGAATFRIEADDALTTLDLDGTIGNGRLLATAGSFLGGSGSAVLEISGPLSDAFSGTMEIAQEDAIAFSENWQLDGDLIFRGGNGSDAATLRVLPSSNPFLEVLNNGVLDVQQGTARFEHRASVSSGGTLNLAGGATLEAARNFSLRSGAVFNFGTISSPATLRVTGADGFLSVGGDAFDLDGASGDNTVEVLDAARASFGADLDIVGGAFDGTFRLGQGTETTFGGRADFAPGSTFDIRAQNLRIDFNGPSRIRTPVTLNGINPGGTGSLSVISVGTDGVHPDASLEILEDINPFTTNDVFQGELYTAGRLRVDIPGVAAWRVGQLGTIGLVDTGSRDALVEGDAIFLDGGRLLGHGTLTANVLANNNALVAPGQGEYVTFTGLASPAEGTGKLDFVGAGLTVNRGARVSLDLAGPNRGQAGSDFGTGFDAIDATGVSLNGGSLRLQLRFSYTPVLYTPHVLIEQTGAGTIAGTFDEVDGVLLTFLPGTALAVTYTDTQVLVQRALIGDANLNGQVEQGDLNAVLSNWGNNNALSFSVDVRWTTGDFNGDGAVDQSDLNAVLANWGSTAPPSFEGFAIPEPAALMLLAPALWLRHRRLAPTA